MFNVLSELGSNVCLCPGVSIQAQEALLQLQSIINSFISPDTTPLVLSKVLFESLIKSNEKVLIACMEDTTKENTHPCVLQVVISKN